MKVCEVCGALMSVIEEESRLQMHNEGRQHQGYLKIRNKLSELKEKYRNCTELGADFLLAGDQKNVFLNEINHHCPALIPLVEAAQKSDKYDGGLGLVKEVVLGGG